MEQLLEHAQKTDRKLLLCGEKASALPFADWHSTVRTIADCSYWPGHSLGGAVAILCTLRVLQQASDAGLSKPRVRCITFGTPAIGNSALASRVAEKGWKDCFQNVILPGLSPFCDRHDISTPSAFCVDLTSIVSLSSAYTGLILLPNTLQRIWFPGCLRSTQKPRPKSCP